jgi:hypothetical protein
VDAFGNALGTFIAETNWNSHAQDSMTARENFPRSEIQARNDEDVGNGEVVLGSTFAGDMAMRKAMNPLLSSVTEFTPEMKADGTRPVYDFDDPFEQDGVVAAAGGASRSTGNAKLTMVPRALYALRDPAVLTDNQAMRRLYGIAMDNSRTWLPSNLSPEETSLTTGMAYHKVFGEDRTAVWFGLAPYATSKVGEALDQLNRFGFMDRADAGIVRSGFFDGNRGIFMSMFTAEQFYQAGGTDSIRAMVAIDRNSFGANWRDDNLEYSKSLVQSFELRDQAKDAFLNGLAGRGEELLGQSLKSSADFEQRVVLQQFYDKPYIANDWRGNPVTKTLRQAIQGMVSIGLDSIAQGFAERMSTVTINGQSLSFTGNDVGDVKQRMPFVYSLAGNLMKTYGSGFGRLVERVAAHLPGPVQRAAKDLRRGCGFQCPKPARVLNGGTDEQAIDGIDACRCIGASGLPAAGRAWKVEERHERHDSGRRHEAGAAAGCGGGRHCDAADGAQPVPEAIQAERPGGIAAAAADEAGRALRRR